MEKSDKLIYYKRLAKSISYGKSRDLKDIDFIVVHFTANANDTAKNNADYFATGNKRNAGAHYFVGRDGVAESIPANFVAWAVGDKQAKLNGGGSKMKVCFNSNSVSVELCDFRKWNDKVANIAAEFITALSRDLLINKNNIIRHYDVTGKLCPAPLIDEGMWNKFLDLIN
jgi:N-acetylmuramoyl-L-alanine amidase CwlA